MKNTLLYVKTWNKPNYIATKVGVFNRVDAYLGRAPKRILDIGCGFAKTSELFQKKYGTELYLLEGEKSVGTGERTGKYGKIDDFRYYLPVDMLKQHWDNQGMLYTFVDGNAQDLSEHIKFDLVYSWLSCGFHYPVGTYRELIQRHTTPDSVIIMDIRCLKGRYPADLAAEGIEVVRELDGNDKKKTLHIRLR